MHQAYSLMLPPFAPDGAVLKSNHKLSDLQSSIDSLRDISITGLDSFANVPARLQNVAQQRIEPRRVDTVSPLSFSLAELDEVFNSTWLLPGSNQSNEQTLLSVAATFGINIGGYGLEGEGGFQRVTDLRGTPFETIQTISTFNSANDLFSILTSGGKLTSSIKGDPAPNWGYTQHGNIRIDCTTNLPANGNPEGILGDTAKDQPGWFSNVNWSADWDSGNGWAPGSTKTTTAANSATYTPDFEIPVVSGGITGGDPDLRKFVVKVAADTNNGNRNWNFKFFFPNAVRVYKNDNTKSESPVESGSVFTPTGSDPVTKTMTFYLEGITASAAFKDLELRAEYVGGNIPMVSNEDKVKVTVFGVTTTGKYGPPNGGSQKSEDNEFSFITPDGKSLEDPSRMPPLSNNQLGKLSYTEDQLCWHFLNCMEVQGTLSPPVVDGEAYPYGYNTIPQLRESPYVSFGAHRWRYTIMRQFNKATNAWEDNPENTPYFQWTSDTTPVGFDLSLSLQSHIYYNDAPGKVGDTTVSFSQWQQTANFRNWFTVKFYGGEWMASPFERWHSQVVLITDPNDNTKLKRDTANQKLAGGWITLPANPL